MWLLLTLHQQLSTLFFIVLHFLQYLAVPIFDLKCCKCMWWLILCTVFARLIFALQIFMFISTGQHWQITSVRASHYSCEFLLLIGSSPSVIQSFLDLHVDILWHSPCISWRSRKKGCRSSIKQRLKKFYHKGQYLIKFYDGSALLFLTPVA